MAAKDTGLSKEEREAVKQRAKELRAQAKAANLREAGTAAVRAAIDVLEGKDREVAEGFYALVTEVSPDLVPKTFYGFPGFANDVGKVVVFMQPASKFKTRYATIGFQEYAHLDEGDCWATSWAVEAWTPKVRDMFADLLAKAIAEA